MKTLLALLLVLLVGCTSSQTSSPSPVHSETAKIQANATQASKSIAAADGKLTTIQADPAVPAPTKATVGSARDDLKTASNAVVEISDKNVPAVNQKADKQKADLEQAVSDAKSSQRKSDERIGQVVVSSAVTLAVIQVVERVFAVSLLTACVPGLIAGGLVFAAFGLILGAFKVVLWFTLGVLLVALGFYLWKRHTQGGLKALFLDSPLKKKPS